MSRHDLPAVPGVLSARQVRDTARAIARVQEADGAVPWVAGQHADVWNHVEAAMALLVGGEDGAADAAYDWVAGTQRTDGSWPMKTRQGVVLDAGGETNMCAYPAVGVWHHWLVRCDRDFVDRMWPVIRDGLDYVVDRQLPFGGIAWCQAYEQGYDGDRPGQLDEHALLAASSSCYQSLRAGVALAELVGDPQPHWEIAGGRLGHALRRHRDLFSDKSTYSMDWYYPVLGGAVRGREGRELIASRWADFVVPDLGIRCVDTNPWVTGAETCELVMALAGLGDHTRARALFADMQHLRAADGGYWTGYVFPDEALWPEECTTFTAAAVVLAADELTRTTPGGGVMAGDTLAPHFAEIGLECGCETAGVRR